MFEKVNPCHPDKVADRIAGALVDAAYRLSLIHIYLVLLGKCEQLWVFGGEVSDGRRREIGKAKQKNIDVYKRQDQLIVDMADEKTVGQRPQGIHENVPGNGLDDVFHKLRAVGFDALPLLGRCV